MSGITTHVLDIARGRPAAGVGVSLSRRDGDGWREVASAITDGDGRVKVFPGAETAGKGTYRLRFQAGAYQAGEGTASFWPFVDIVFEVADAESHHHVPLLLSPFGYSTYRGS